MPQRRRRQIRRNILVFGVWLRWLPISAAWPDGAGFFTQLYHLILPALPLFLVLFGYIARMARAGMIEALEYKGNSYNANFPACSHPEHHTV